MAADRGDIWTLCAATGPWLGLLESDHQDNDGQISILMWVWILFTDLEDISFILQVSSSCSLLEVPHCQLAWRLSTIEVGNDRPFLWTY